MVDSVVIAFSTCPDQATADSVASALVVERLATCVNRVPGARSTYFWDGRLQDDAEILLIIKTTAAKLPALELRLRALHPYQVPELVALDAVGGSSQYLDWVRRGVGDHGQ